MPTKKHPTKKPVKNSKVAKNKRTGYLFSESDKLFLVALFTITVLLIVSVFVLSKNIKKQQTIYNLTSKVSKLDIQNKDRFNDFITTANVNSVMYQDFVKETLAAKSVIKYRNEKLKGDYETIKETNLQPRVSPATGKVKLVKMEDTNYLVFNDLTTNEGPDLKVYTATSIEEGWENMGTLAANKGDIYYTLPNAVDPQEVKFVLIYSDKYKTVYSFAQF